MIYTARFDTVQDLAKFYKNTSGVDFTSDAYEFLGSYCVQFTLGIQTQEIVQTKISKASGVMILPIEVLECM